MKKILATAIATFLLAGCSQIGAAATVGHTKHTQALFQASVDAIFYEPAKGETTQMPLENGPTPNILQIILYL